MQMGRVPVAESEEDKGPIMGATGPIVFVPDASSKKKTSTVTPPVPKPVAPVAPVAPTPPARPGDVFSL